MSVSDQVMHYQDIVVVAVVVVVVVFFLQYKVNCLFLAGEYNKS